MMRRGSVYTIKKGRKRRCPPQCELRLDMAANSNPHCLFFAIALTQDLVTVFTIFSPILVLTPILPRYNFDYTSENSFRSATVRFGLTRVSFDDLSLTSTGRYATAGVTFVNYFSSSGSSGRAMDNQSSNAGTYCR